MTAVAPAALVAAAPSTGTARAQAQGLPATLFGFTPEQPEYWLEPELPWLTLAVQANMPLDYLGGQALICVGDIDTDRMAPRFPRGCSVQTVPVYEKKNLAVGRVYTYRFWDALAQAWSWEIGRLVKVGGNYLEVKADNNPTPSLWLLSEVPGQEVWDVREVTHYASHPAAAAPAAATHLAAA